MKSGQMLAHYRVEEKIGQGGMGEVYRAHDTVLGRDVALKVLPKEFAVDADRLARFQREAKVLASLHHPNIASIFGFENTEECTFLVLEYVEGQDLSEVLKSGAIPQEDAVDIAAQIAEGLEEAHEKGIIHRDLKPANVKRTPDGKVKVLDFGLARAFLGETAAEEHLSSSPTMTAAMTQAGTVLGTAAYMSPEQARGKEVDRRTDIWAFGVILFEMLTGKQLFEGETPSDTLAEILKTDPDWDALPGDLPPQVAQVMHRCLSKDPRQRLRDIGEARVRLENPEAESGLLTGSFAVATDPGGFDWRRAVPWGLLAASVAVIAWLFVSGVGGGVETRNYHVTIPAPEGAEFNLGTSYPALPTISPDGTHVVFGARSEEDGSLQLYVRALDSGRAVALDGTEDGQYPFWSADSKWIGFFDRNEGMKKIPVGGGPTLAVCPAQNAKGGSWNADGEIIFPPEYNSSLFIAQVIGGVPVQVTDLDADEGFDSHRHPQFMPDGRHFIYLARGTGGQGSEVRLASLDEPGHKVVMKVNTGAQYANGHLVFLNQQTLMAQPFNPSTGELDGTAVPIAEEVMVITGAAKGVFSVSDEGTLVYLSGLAEREAALHWMDRHGVDLGEVGDMASYNTVRLSTDNRRAAVVIMDRQGGTSDIWIVDIERNFRTQHTFSAADDVYPVWLPDNRTTLFVSNRSGEYSVYRKAVGSGEEAELMLELDRATLLWDVHPDGKTILYSTRVDSTGLDLWSADLTGAKEPRRLTRGQAAEGAASFSPDGNWVTFWATESGRGQTFVTAWPAFTPLTQVSTTSGTWSFWRGDNRQLVYKTESGKLWSVDLVPNGDEMRISAATELFDHSSAQLEGTLIDLTSDGERFLAISSFATDPPAVCEVVIGWPSKVAPR